MAERPSDIVKRLARQGISSGQSDAAILAAIEAARAPRESVTGFIPDFQQEVRAARQARRASSRAASQAVGSMLERVPATAGQRLGGSAVGASAMTGGIPLGPVPGGPLAPTPRPPLALGAGMSGGVPAPTFGSVIDTTATERPAARAAQQATYARPMPAAPMTPPPAAAGMADDAVRAAAGGADDVVGAAARQAATSGFDDAALAAARAAADGRMTGPAMTLADLGKKGATAGGRLGWLTQQRNIPGIGRSTSLLRGVGPGIVGMIGGNIVQDAMGNDPMSRTDDMVGSGIRWAGAGAGLGSPFGPVGMALGALGGGAFGVGWGWLKGDDMKQEISKLDTRFDELSTELGLSQESYDQLRSELNVALEFAGSKEEAEAIYQQTFQQLPTLAQQDAAIMEQNARSAALQAAILPLMEEQMQMARQSAQSSAGWLRSAANRNGSSEVGDLLRAQADQLMASQANYSQAAYGQMAAAPMLQQMLGVQAPAPTTPAGTTDLSSVLAQLQLAPS